MTADATDAAVDVAANRAAWLAALRSGTYAQGFGQLRFRSGGYCCLGVAEAVRGADWCVVDGNRNVIRDARPDDDDRTLEPGLRFAVRVEPADVPASGHVQLHVLTPAASRWLGLVTVDPNVVVRYVPFGADVADYQVTTLSLLNDNHNTSLAEVADVIADQPPDWDGSLERAERDRAARRNPSNEEEPS